MATRTVTSGDIIESVADLHVGAGIYAEASGAPYWVAQITETRVVLQTMTGNRETWVRETLEASLVAKTWIHQSTASASADHAPRRRDAH